MINEKMPFVFYGGDYNPDQWDDKTIDEDMLLFKKMNVNMVTLPVFSWAKLEPSDGVYDFDWLDRILKKLEKNNINVFLATPTTAQPAWMSVKYPEVLPVDIMGRKRTHGMRVYFCPNSGKYREASAKIAAAMALRYKDYKGLAAWHICNEYGTYCYCENCQQKFRTWLKERYKTVEELNDRWNLSFWGRTVYSFNEVFLPSDLNDDDKFYPAIRLDYIRFMTDSTLECFRNEYNVIKAITPNIPITTNISGFIKKLDQFKMAANMDVMGWDNYPSPTHNKSLIALKHNIMRGLKNGKPYLMTEQSPNQQNWQPYNKLKRPGEVRLLSYQALANGAESVLYFQMRQSRAGIEKLHGALISHAGHENTRIFRETAQLGAELKKIGSAFLGTCIKSKVALLFDWDNWWAVELSSGPNRDLQYLDQVEKYYKAFYNKNISVDIVSVDSDLSSYEIVIAPLLYMVKKGMADKLKVFVKAGGTFISSFFSGIVDENDRVTLGGYPGELSEILGIWVEETDALLPDEENKMIMTDNRFNLKKSYSCGLLCDIVHIKKATSLAVYGCDFYKGESCLTVNSYGKGKAYYIATDPQEEFLSEFTGEICKEKGIKSFYNAPRNVEITKRTSDDKEIVFILNHNDNTVKVELGEEKFINLLNDMEINGEVILDKHDVAVLKKI